MKRLLLTLRFVGTNYAGWQVQRNAPAVQKTLQDAAERVFGARPGITGCSRTDSGVHALMFCCHLDTDSDIPPERLPAALNANLPRDIAVTGAREVPPDFHARYSCKSKTYQYRMYRSEYRDPFYDPMMLRLPRDVSPAHMSAAAARFVRTADFTSFCAAGSSVADPVRTVFRCGVTRDEPFVTLEAEGDGFLYNMVRIMAGTLIETGMKQLPPEHIDEIIAARDRGRAGKTAPAHALYLAEVKY